MRILQSYLTLKKLQAQKGQRMTIDKPPHMVSLYSASQGHPQRPWHFSPQPLHQARLHPYQQKPRPQQCNHVIQHYGLPKKGLLLWYKIQIVIQVKQLVLLQFSVWITPQDEDRMMGSLLPTILHAKSLTKINWWSVRINIPNIIGVWPCLSLHKHEKKNQGNRSFDILA